MTLINRRRGSWPLSRPQAIVYLVPQAAAIAALTPRDHFGIDYVRWRGAFSCWRSVECLEVPKSVVSTPLRACGWRKP